jgi:hypothetical protein
MKDYDTWDNTINDTLKSIRTAVDFNYKNQGYIDINFIVRVTNIPELIIRSVLEQDGFSESLIKGQLIKRNKNEQH